jgi:hypothetical protein
MHESCVLRRKVGEKHRGYTSFVVIIRAKQRPEKEGSPKNTRYIDFNTDPRLRNILIEKETF